MKILTILIIFVITAVIAAAVEIYRELHHFCVTDYTIRQTKLSGLTDEAVIVFLSDLHCRTYGKNNEKLFRAVTEAKPDLILIGGDMLVGKKHADCTAALEFVKILPSVAPVCYALGNHERRMKENPEIYGYAYERFKAEAMRAGVVFLENKSVTAECRGIPIRVAGLELPDHTYKKFRKAAVTPVTVEEALVQEPAVTGNPYTVLLAHNPVYMDAYLGWGADLVLSGHLHGGLVRVPGLGGIVTPQGFFFPRYSGEITRKGEQTVIVSRGLGTHTLNIRLFNMPELIVIRLKKPL